MNEKHERERFKDNVRKALLKREQPGDIFIAGMPHPVFVSKGMSNLPYHISPAVIRKARKVKYNGHNVKQEDLERLPELLNNPIALFKSLTKPNSFVVVLDAKDKSEKPVIVSVSPKNGFNEITSIYGRDNFFEFVQMTNKAGYVLSINKKKAIEGVDPAVQFRGGATFDDFQEPVSRRAEKVSSGQFAIKPARGLNRANNILGESNMTQDEIEALEAQCDSPTPEEIIDIAEQMAALSAAIVQKNTVLDALKKGTLACLPYNDDYPGNLPAVNISNGLRFHGAAFLQIKEHTRSNGFPTAEYITDAKMKEAGIPLKAGEQERGIALNFNGKNKDGTWENKTATVYNIHQSAEPEKLKAWAQAKRDASVSQRPEEKSPEVKGERVFECSSTEPAAYLGEFFAAVSIDAGFYVSQRQAAEFSQKLQAMMEMKKPDQKYANPFIFANICNEAEVKCVNLLKNEVKPEAEREPVGTLTYADSGESVNYYSADEMLATYKKELDYNGLMNAPQWSTPDEELKRELYKAVGNEYGGEEPAMTAAEIEKERKDYIESGEWMKAFDGAEFRNEKERDKALGEYLKYLTKGDDYHNEYKQGFVQGVCECANVVKEKSLELAENLLKETGVTKSLARKYADPETFKEMQKDIFAPKIEQKIEQTQSRGRGM